MSVNAMRLEEMGRLLRSEAKWASLHTADPGKNGEHEVDTPRYRRQRIEWDTGGRNQYSMLFTIDHPQGTALPITYIGCWDHEQGGTIQFSDRTKLEYARDDYTIPQRVIRARVEERVRA